MEFKINYNPYKLSSDFCLDGKKLPEDSRFTRIKEKRFQQWLNKTGDWNGLSDELMTLTNEGRINVKFKGRIVEFEDLKLYLEQNDNEKIILSDSAELVKNDKDIMSKLDNIVKKIKETGNQVFTSQQIEEIIESYQSAKDAKFKVCVIATMSSGKSTLINALIGSDLLPSNTSACTATITTITDDDNMERFDAHCYDAKGKEVDKQQKVSLEKMEKFNLNSDIKRIDLIGRIPGVKSEKISLFLVDTPGTNNSTNDDHEKLTDEIINSDENTMVIYVMSPETIQSDDNNKLLESIANIMKKDGKQAEDRFLFVINKCDKLDPEDEDDTVKNTIEITKKYLKSKGILYPNIFPVTAEMAKLIRMDKQGEKITRKDKKEIGNWIDNFESDKLEDKDYQKLLSFEKFASLGPASRNNIEENLKKAKNEKNVTREALIHTGVPALEETIEEYLEKYAYPMKINDSLKELIEIIGQEEMKKNFEKEIYKSKTQLQKVQKDIQISNEKMQQLKDKKEKINRKINSFKFNVSAEDIKKEMRRKTNRIVNQYAGKTEVKEEESNRIFDEVNREQKKYTEKLEKELSKMIEQEIVKKGNKMLAEFRSFMDAFKKDIKIGNFDFDKMISFKSCDINSLDTLIEKNTQEKTHQETYFIDNPKRDGFFGKLKFWQPKEISREKKVSDGNFVNVKNVIQNAMMQWETELNEQIDDIFSKAKTQVEEFKAYFKQNMNQTEEIVNKTLKEISYKIDSSLKMEKQEKEKTIEKNKSNLAFINSINNELNEILNF